MSALGGLPAWQHGGRHCEKSAEAMVVQAVGEAREAPQGRKERETDRPSRERRTKGRILRCKESVGNDSMGVKRQQSEGDRQMWLFNDNVSALSRHDASGEGGTGPAAFEASQAPTVLDPARALTVCLMEEVCQRDNLNRAYRRVKANKGAAGVDGMTVHELGVWLKEHKGRLIASLLEGSYHPQPVRGVEIPKPGGGMRQLGIPTVVDRLVQQAILQVLEPLLDPTFSASSYGFRPKRGAHDAFSAARK